MSWAQRKGPSRPTATGNPPVQMYNPNQHSNPEWQATNLQAWQPPPPNQQQSARQDPNQRQPYWPQQPQPTYPTSHTPNGTPGQYQQQYEQPGYFQNSAPAYNQQVYGNVQYSQQYDQNNLYSSQPPQQQPANEWASWEWGDDDNSNTQPVASTQPPVVNQPIADSFANDESWNWSVTEQPEQNNMFPTVGDLKSKTDRKKLETPQWSTESQPSVESSDDVLQTSESDKSHMVSRSSTISHSPISGQEISPPMHQIENNEVVTQRVNPTPPLPKNVQTPPLLLPPQGGAAVQSDNPYKRTAGLSHKAAHKFKPPAVAAVTQTFNQAANLETLPDNSEHPDHPIVGNSTKTGSGSVAGPQWAQIENNEAPINDRNQYLETGQLSEVNLSADASEAVDVGNDTLPPPGLQRMIPGQMEQPEPSDGQPLPGFSRMVLGQNESNSEVTSQNPSQYDLSGPPEGLRRMVPGESSSPETSMRQPHAEENDSELELNQLAQSHGTQLPRSAAIGADTPPIQSQPQSILQTAPSSRSETIGSDLAVSLGGDASDLPLTSSVMESKPGKHSSKAPKEKVEPDTRREAVEGQTNDLSVSGLTAAVRNLTVGENLTDGHTSNNSLPELSPRRHSRQESSESDSDRKMARNRSDKRTEKSKSREKDRGDRDRYRERNNDRDRYSPDTYREKRGKRYRDRRYEEQDTDYYSDKERRPRDDRDRDYERKYSSLRKEKDRRRKEPREYRESRRGADYYYGRYGGEDYGPENRSSRPSSRSDSMHESYRERRHEGVEHRDRRNRDRERERYNRNREPHHGRDVYNPYQSFAYDPYNPYYRQYQYYENLRRTNPEAYAEWYRKYYQQAAGSTYTGEDRASVHSGRSSANDELNKDRYTRQSFYSQSNYYGQSHSISGHYGLDNSSMTYNRTLDQTDNSLIYEEQPSAAQRLTPTKFATAHLKASIASGRLVRVLPNYPMDGQSAVVEVCNLQTLLEHDPSYMELCSFPGPLIKGVTHKKQIIEYCDSKIRGATYNRDIADVESYVLMWELLILLIRQNGMVVGTDIAELLLKSRNSEPIRRPSSALSNTSSNVGDRNDVSEASNQPVSEQGSTQSILKEEEVTKKFREFLLYGSCQEALEWAMKHGLWGHALFLASKLDKRTYANVMMRFANGLTMNDPLQTLYQLLSGKMPAVVTCASDEKWGDWRPHLAMILSNSTQRPELNCKAITQLGDTLLNRGSLYAAQFCYLMAEAGFGRHGDPDAKLVLLGSDHRKPFPQVATNEAIHMTEIYEFACSLNDQEFSIPEFQLYKFLLASRLADFGLLQRSLQYLELLAKRIICNPEGVAPSLIEGVCTLADKLKFYDPVGDADEGDELEFGGVLETSRPDNSWLKDLRAIQGDCRTALPDQDYEGLHATISTDNTLQQSAYGQDVWQQEQQLYDQQQQVQFEQHQQQYQETTSVWGQEQPNQGGFHSQESQPLLSAQTYPEQQNYWPGQQTQPWSGEPPQTSYGQETVNQDPSSDLYDNSNNQFEEPRPQISLPNQPKGRSAFDDEPLPHEMVDKKPEEAAKPKPQSPKKDAGGSQNTGWFGGIFSRFSKSKNEVKLPDDKNPKIVWDENKKRWVNLDEDPNDPANELKPPPKMTQIAPQLRAPGTLDVSNAHASFVGFSSGTFNNNVVDYNIGSGPMSLPVLGSASARNEEAAAPRPAAPQTNMFKMQRNRNVKNAYVDVFKQNGVKSEPVPAPEPVPMIGQPASMNFFIPQPVANPNAPVDFLTPGGATLQSGEAQISRWSSTSSLSREVASYMNKSRRTDKT